MSMARGTKEKASQLAASWGAFRCVELFSYSVLKTVRLYGDRRLHDVVGAFSGHMIEVLVDD